MPGSSVALFSIIKEYHLDMTFGRGEKKLSLGNRLFKRSEAPTDGVYGIKTFYNPGNAIVE
jgi:hypothetical protein